MKDSGIVLSLLVLTVALVVLVGMVPEGSRASYESTVEYLDTPSIPDDFLDIQDARARKQYLIDILLPLVLKANKKISRQRRTLESIKKTAYWFSAKEKRVVDELAGKYRVEGGDYRTMVDELLLRVDVLPNSLILAQAAIESGWGTSRFALEGNNLFGLRTLSGRGMVPKDRDDGKAFKVSRFKDLQSSIDYYLWNINSHPKYEELRQIRSRQTYPYDPFKLAQGLRHYSEIGEEYVQMVIWLIEYNNLQEYDSYTLQ
jgi:Bax protein